MYTENGYYFEPNILELNGSVSELKKHMIVPKYDHELQEVSKKLLLKDENKLVFMNAIKLRNTVAINHYINLKNIQSSTQSLIKELRNLNHD